MTETQKQEQNQKRSGKDNHKLWKITSLKKIKILIKNHS